MAKKSLKKYTKEYFMIILGSLITALSINIFLVPHKISPGGVSGIATVIYYLSGGIFPIGTLLFIFNIPLFIAGTKLIGKTFAAKTLLGLVLLSFFLDSTKLLMQAYFPIEKFFTSSDLLLFSLFGGATLGLGLGIVFRAGATTGGTDIGAKILHHFFPSFTIGQHLLIIETGIVIFVTIAFQSILLALYAIVTLFVSTKVIDAVLEGVKYAKAVFIISDKSNVIAKKILKDLDRGVTSLKGVGMYTGSEKNVLLCILHREQLSLLKDMVHKIDNNAFVILTDVREVLGEGFKTYE